MFACYLILEKTKYIPCIFMMQRYPIIRNGKLQKYQFEHVIKVLDISKNSSQAEEIVTKYVNFIKNDPDRYIHPDYKTNSDFNSWEQQQKQYENCTLVQKGLLLPKTFQPIFITKQEAESIIYKEGRWIQAEELELEKQKQDMAEIMLANKILLDQLTQRQSTEGFVNLLEIIPNFHIKLTDQEKEVIAEPKNVLVLGRSGTGKTTCAVLRLFASEVLFRYRAHQLKIKKSDLLGKKQMGPEELESSCGLHIIFATASPVLTNEVRRYYHRLVDQVKQEMKQRQQRAVKKREEAEHQRQMEEQKRKMEEEKEWQQIQISYEEIEEEKVTLELIKKDELSESDVERDDEEEELQQVQNMHSLSQVNEESFPLFLTIRRLILMIDGTLQRPFFARDVNNKIIGMAGNSEWHNEVKGVVMINREFKDEQKQIIQELTEQDLSSSSESEYEEEYEDISFQKKEKVEKKYKGFRKKYQDRIGKGQKNQKMSFEIEYDYFVNNFFKLRCQAWCDIKPIMVWTEIVSYIKGHAQAHRYMGRYIPKWMYLELGKKNSLLSQESRETVFEVFCRYERWKYTQGAYDFQDVVNYVLSQIQYQGYDGQPIHFMMIDEVQDLTHATLLLLLKITEQNLFFSGDTAQTIARGVGFRFCDLKSLFQEYQQTYNLFKLEIPQVKSHQRILDLANTVVSFIECMFPQTIDRLAKERANVDGVPPMFVNDVNALCELLFGREQVQQHNQDNKKVEFGCDQVILVRDQAAKEKIPGMLKYALCLTIYEAKGLEFDDVILYNFFTDSTCDQWKIINNLVLSQQYQEGKYQVLDLENLEIQENQEIESEKLKFYMVSRYFTPQNYSLLCSELKHLYVAITRPRKRLVFFEQELDENKEGAILKIWNQLGLITTINLDNSGQLQANNQQGNAFEVCQIAQKTSQEAWKKQGIRMMKHGFYQQAQLCFEYSGDSSLHERAKAYAFATEASRIISDYQNDQESKAHQTKQAKEQNRKNLKKAKQLFISAAEAFKGLGLMKQTARCYFSAECFVEAANVFKSTGKFLEAGEAYVSNQDYVQAAECFDLAGDYLKAINMFRKAKQWEKVLLTIEKFSDQMSKDDKFQLVEKYVPLALEDLMQQMIYTSQEDKIHETQMQREDEKEVKQIHLLEDISEDSSDETGTDEDLLTDEENLEKKQKQEEEMPKLISEEEVIQTKQKEKVEKQKGNIKQIKTSEVSSSSVSQESSFKIIDPHSSFELLSVPKLQSEQSFSVVEACDQFSNIDAQTSEFLKLETGSVVESIITGKQISHTDYSLVDNPFASALQLEGCLIKTKADIYVQDEIMQKIIKYVSMFSKEVRQSLTNLRSKEILLTQTSELAASWEALAYMVDMDQVDINLVSLLLDSLEHFQLFKLCLIVCNRYHLPQRLGRYVVSIASKFSKLSVYNAKNIKFAPSQEIAIISQVALHNVLEMINPIYFRSSKERLDQYEQNLGYYCYQGLVLLGYWKKSIFMVDFENAMCVTSTFGDFDNYKYIFLQNLQGKLNEESIQAVSKQDFTWLPFSSAPKALSDLRASLIALDSVNWRLNSKLYTEVIPEFPSYFAFSGVLWNYLQSSQDQEKVLQFIKHACEGVDSLFKGQEFKSKVIALRIHDVFSFITHILLAASSKLNLQQILVTMQPDQFHQFLQAITQIITLLQKKHSAKGFSCYFMYALAGVLSAFQIRLISPCESTNLLYHNACIVKITSWVAHELRLLQGKDFNLAGSDNKNKVKTKKQQINWDQAQRLVLSKAYVCDVDANLLIVQLEAVTQIINKKMAGVLKKIVQERKNQVQDKAGSTVSEIILSEKLEHFTQDKSIKKSIVNEKFDIITFHMKQDIKSQLRKIRQETEELDEAELEETKFAQEIKDLTLQLEKFQTQEDSFVQQLKPFLLKFYNEWDFSTKQKNPQMKEVLLSIAQNQWNMTLQAMQQQANVQEILDKKLLKIFKLMHVCDQQIMFQEYIRKKSKAFLKKQGFQDIKCQNETSFKTATLLLDMSVYLQNNCWSEFISSCLQYIQFAEINVRNKLNLLQKCLAVLLFARPHAKRVYYPFAYTRFFNLEFNPKDNTQARFSEKVTLIQSPKLVKDWIQEMGKLSGMINTKEEAVISYIMVVTAIINMTEAKFDNELFQLLIHFSEIKKWITPGTQTAFDFIVNQKDVPSYRQQFGKNPNKLFYFSNLDTSVVLIERMHTLTSFDDHYKALDKAFYHENKTLAARINIARCIQNKLKSKKVFRLKKVQMIQNINEVIAFSQISESIL